MAINSVEAFGLNIRNADDIALLGDGLINDTWKVNCGCGGESSPGDSDAQYVLQRINQNVFKNPMDIDSNLCSIGLYLRSVSSTYLFTNPVPALSGETLIKTEDGYFRLFRFIPNSVSYNVCSEPGLAYEAAKQFGLFTSVLQGFDSSLLAYTIPDFHNLPLRYSAFQETKLTADSLRLQQAQYCMCVVNKHKDIVDIYEKEIRCNPGIKLRVCHHDTKISNVLFDQNKIGLCVVDLDTVMPGYFISDIGDMFRTYLCADSEEVEIPEPSLFETTHRIRLEYFKAIVEGYLFHMGATLTTAERQYIIYAGKYMIYMQGVRFLTDFLNGDKYYKTTHALHNLFRANNQLTLLEEYCSLEASMNEILHCRL